MTKLRTPRSFEDAVGKVVGFLHLSVAADLLGKKGKSLIYKWTNEANDATPTLRQALMLEAAYVEAGGEGTPIFDAYAAQLDIAQDRRAACRIAYTGELAAATRECGEALAAGIALTQPGASPLAVQRAMIEAQQAHGAFGLLMKRMQSFLSSSTGLDAGNTGEAK